MSIVVHVNIKETVQRWKFKLKFELIRKENSLFFSLSFFFHFFTFLYIYISSPLYLNSYLLMETLTEDFSTVDNTETVDLPKLPWANSYKRGFAPIADKKLYYELHGEGPIKAAFLMGLNTHCQCWDYQIKYFGSHKDFTILIFDARGVGLTGGDWEFYNTEQWAQDFLDLLDYLNWKSNVHACGYSAGGCVLLKAILKDKQRFQSASFICTTAGSLYRPFTGAYTLISNIFYEPKIQMARLIRINYTDSFLNARPDDDAQYETNYEKIVAKIIERNQRSKPQKLGGMVSQAIASLRHWVSNKELDQIQQSGLPITIMTNTWDNFVHTGDSYLLRDKLKPKKFIVFENTGHVVPTAKYQEVNELLHSFWTEYNK
ncbi:unnamed protein product [Cunninghamella blakesleeana]